MPEKNLNMDFVRPFGPPIGIVQMPNGLVNEINDYIDGLSREKTEKLDHGKSLAGNVNKEILLEKSIVEKNWLPFISKTAQVYVELHYKKEIKEFHLIKTWVVRQFKNEYNPIHWHTGHLSGVAYLKVPKNMGNYVQKNKDESDNKNGQLVFSHGAKMFLANSVMHVKPEVGKFIIFPHYMMHSVYPFHDTEEERRSISFNAKIDNEIYDYF